MNSEIPTWAINLGMGAALIAWFELRFPRRSECALKHKGIETQFGSVDVKLEERRESTHELKNIVQSLITKVAVVENDTKHLTTVVESIAAKVGANGFTPRSKRHEG